MTLRIGLLGAARIAPGAVIEPARTLERVEVVGVAARDRTRAEAFAAEHELPQVFADYDELITADSVDAVYIGLPASAHAPWTIAALEAGKHVLCEKPFACSLAEAQAMVDTGRRTGLVLCEAFHWRYHPLADRITELLDSGAIGKPTTIDAEFSTPIPDLTDIRHDLALGGGAMMDLGCYAIQWARHAVGGEAVVVDAVAVEGALGIDVEMEATLSFDSGVTATVRTSMAPETTRVARLLVAGDEGTLEVNNPLAPHLGHSLTVTNPSGRTTETVAGETTYAHQLRAFVAAVLDGALLPTGGRDATATMALIEASYAAAGLPPRGTPPNY